MTANNEIGMRVLAFIPAKIKTFGHIKRLLNRFLPDVRV